MTDLILMRKPSEDHLPGWQKETDWNHIDPPRRTRTVLCNRGRNRKANRQDLLRCPEIKFHRLARQPELLSSIRKLLSGDIHQGLPGIPGQGGTSARQNAFES